MTGGLFRLPRHGLGGPLAGRPQEWLRAAVGAGLGLTLTLLACSHFYGTPAALRLLGPLGATAILLFAVPSGAFSQPWPVIGGYLAGTAVSAAVAAWLGHSPLALGVALGGTVLVMCAGRCLHPPAGAIALCLMLGGPPLAEQGVGVVGLALLGAGCLLTWALAFNNLTGTVYPRRLVPRAVRTPRQRRAGIAGDDLDQALREHGELLDISRADLQAIVARTEGHALRRNFGAVTAGMIMTRDLRLAQPEMPVEQALQRLLFHHLRALPVVDATGQLVGIVSLTDLMAQARAVPTRRWAWRRAPRRATVAAVMTAEVISVAPDTPLVDLIPLMSRQGLHCLPVAEAGRVVGVVSQGDLIDGVHRDLFAG